MGRSRAKLSAESPSAIAGISPGGFDTFVPLAEDAWQHVRYIFDVVNGTVTVDVDGQPASTVLNDTTIDGITFELEPTEAGGADGPMYLDNFRIAESVDMDCDGDVDGDGDIDQSDLGLLLANWGEGCP